MSNLSKNVPYWLEWLVDDMEDFQEMRRYSSKNSYKSSKMTNYVKNVWVDKALKKVIKPRKKGNYYRNEVNASKRQIKWGELHYIILIKIMDFLDSF